MKGKFEAPRGGRGRRRRRKSPILPIILMVLILGGCAALAVRFWPEGTPNKPDTSLQATDPVTGETLPTDPQKETEPDPTETEAPTEPEPLTVVATATISTTGDLLMHKPVINTGAKGDGSYDFESVFRYLTPYSSAADYAIANLETTLCGTNNGYEYSGYPMFNCPDGIASSAQTAGFDMLLTANNHCYDTRLVGMKRTLEVISGLGLDTLGTMSSAEAPKYLVKDINGIKIGFLCYTYETADNYPDRPSMNAILTSEESVGMINSFDYNQLDKFYGEIETHMAAMEAEGAEGTVLFIHWGEEYQLRPNTHQTTIAQKLCDLGIDAIVGGHPHVVQPMDLLTSTVDPAHKTVCLYSLGNAVSNQRLGNLQSINTAHTEDGMLFSVTFAKYSDGTVALEATDVLPCWVNLRYDTAKEYNILPLDADTMDQWQTLYNLSEGTFNAAKKSYDRTMALVGEGLEECQTYLAEAKQQREADYLAALETP